MKVGIAILSILIICVASYFLYENHFIPYHPSHIDPRTINGIVIDDHLLSINHKIAFVAILIGYGYSFRVEANDVYVKRNMPDDLLATLTSKAESVRGKFEDPSHNVSLFAKRENLMKAKTYFTVQSQELEKYLNSNRNSTPETVHAK